MHAESSFEGAHRIDQQLKMIMLIDHESSGIAALCIDAGGVKGLQDLTCQFDRYQSNTRAACDLQQLSLSMQRL